MKVTEIQVFKYFPNHITTKRMKGSLIKRARLSELNHNSQQHIPQNDLAILQLKQIQNIVIDDQQSLLQRNLSITKPHIGDINDIAKTVNIHANKQRQYSSWSAKTRTPIPARQYVPSNRIDERNQEKNLQTATPSRYTLQETEQDNEVRMSLSRFHDNLRSVLSASKTRMPITEEEMINMKLQGTNYRAERKSKGSEIKKQGNMDKSIIFEQQLPTYMTQQKNSPKFTKQTSHFRQIISRLEVQSDRPSSEFLSKRLQPTSRSLHLHVNSRKKLSLQEQVVRKQPARVNIVNIREQRPFAERGTSHELIHKFMRQQGTHQHTNKEKVTAESKKNLINELTEMVRQINDRKGQQRRQPEKQEKLMTTYVDDKIKRRKSLMKQYTFKKSIQQLIQRPSKTPQIQDFAVEGWINREGQLK